MTKTISSKNNIHTTTITRADWDIKFYSYETRSHHTRRVWFSRTSDIFVKFNGRFWCVVTESRGKYDPWLCGEYHEI